MEDREKRTHRSVMLNILREIYTDRSLGSVLGFKGGTAAYFFYKLPRFSVDLDFDLLENDELNTADLLNNLSQKIGKYGNLTDVAEKQSTILLELNYKKGYRNLKVEISTRNDQNSYSWLNLYGIKCQVMEEEFMFARKLIALTHRKRVAARDLFDINYFLNSGWEPDRQTIELATQLSFKEYIDSVINFIENNFTVANVLDGAGELLTESERKSTAFKQSLIQETVFKLRVLANLD